MTDAEIKNNKAQFLSLCREYIHRDGIDGLLDYLENKTDFFTAPSSTSFHLNEDGGLCQHSINVFRAAMTLNSGIVAPAIEAGTSAFTTPLPTESIALAALFHDVCKTKICRKAERWKKDENGRWVSYPGYEIQDEFPFGHGEKSCVILGWFVRLRQEELLAIRWHMGMFDMAEPGSSSRYAYRAAMERSPLVSLLQCADLIASNCLEKTTKWK